MKRQRTNLKMVQIYDWLQNDREPALKWCIVYYWLRNDREPTKKWCKVYDWLQDDNILFKLMQSLWLTSKRQRTKLTWSVYDWLPNDREPIQTDAKFMVAFQTTENHFKLMQQLMQSLWLTSKRQITFQIDAKPDESFWLISNRQRTISNWYFAYDWLPYDKEPFQTDISSMIDFQMTKNHFKLIFRLWLTSKRDIIYWKWYTSKVCNWLSYGGKPF